MPPPLKINLMLNVAYPENLVLLSKSAQSMCLATLLDEKVLYIFSSVIPRQFNYFSSLSCFGFQIDVILGIRQTVSQF